LPAITVLHSFHQFRGGSQAWVESCHDLENDCTIVIFLIGLFLVAAIVTVIVIIIVVVVVVRPGPVSTPRCLACRLLSR
jgi:hypothetical protein